MNTTKRGDGYGNSTGNGIGSGFRGGRGHGHGYGYSTGNGSGRGYRDCQGAHHGVGGGGGNGDVGSDDGDGYCGTSWPSRVLIADADAESCMMAAALEVVECL